MSKPKILILDEITNGLDLQSANNLINLLKKLNKEEKITILFASHIFDHIRKLCNKILILYKGKVLAYDTIENLRKEANLMEYISIKTKSPIP